VKQWVFEDKIELTNVCFHYESGHKNVLEQISLSIARGESIGLIGPSGAGKSTLVDIILGLLPVSSGRVTVDGIDITTQGYLRAWQDKIGYVAQSIYLTDDTLRRNIAFGISDALIDDHKVAKAVQAAQLDDFVHQLPQGLQTPVGERGVRLSGGQRQRIGIARALYADPPVLVLDEATSALDIETEKEVMVAVNALQGKKTIIIIAHRLTSIAQCDRIYKIDKGRIIVREQALVEEED